MSLRTATSTHQPCYCHYSMLVQWYGIFQRPGIQQGPVRRFYRFCGKIKIQFPMVRRTGPNVFRAYNSLIIFISYLKNYKNKYKFQDFIGKSYELRKLPFIFLQKKRFCFLKLIIQNFEIQLLKITVTESQIGSIKYNIFFQNFVCYTIFYIFQSKRLLTV